MHDPPLTLIWDQALSHPHIRPQRPLLTLNYCVIPSPHTHCICLHTSIPSLDTSVPSECRDPIVKDISWHQWDIILSALFDTRDCESDTDGRISIPGPVGDFFLERV